MAKIRQPIDEGGAELVVQSAPEENMSHMIEFLVKKDSSVTSWPDKDGVTPLHRAASLSTPYNREISKLIIEHWPQSAEVCDGSGRSILHLLLSKKIPSYQEGKALLDVTELYALRNHQDKDGNTPLHVAVENKDTIMIRVLLESSTKTNINNNKGVCATSAIQQQKVFQIEKTIKDSYELVGVRSFWGISTTKTETYMSTMGIIAALLATITFTAAFTVPGGLFEDIGTPIMIKKTSFQVFMIFDVIAMCLSTIVLIFLLKIMATTDRRNSVVILDLCIALTLMSFGATLVTFMTGLFAAMFSVKRWIAIVTIVLCSLITALVLIFLFKKLVVPFKQTILYFSWMSGKKSIQSSKAKPRTEANNQGHPQRPPV